MDSLNRGINSIHQKVNLLTSYSHILKNKSQKVQLPSNMNKLMIDSGAYDLLIRGKLEEYPFSPKEYANAIKSLEIHPNYVVSMDYICSREEKNNNKELIQKTIKNAEILRKEFGRDKKLCFIPVVQGYKLKDYLFCINDLVKKKVVINNDHIGIGSLVGRRNLKETREIIKSIYEYLRKNDISVNIHCFGLNLSVIKNEEIFNMVNSIDSLAWTFPYRFGRVKVFTRERMIEANSNGSLKESEFYFISLNATLNYINFLNLRYCPSDSKPINKIINIGKDENFVYKELAHKMGIPELHINKSIINEELFDMILKQNKKFPRESDLIIDKIPVYTSHKLSILEPKNTQIGKIEFLYLFLSAIDFAYTDIRNKENKTPKDLLTLLEDYYAKLSENELSIIKESLNEFSFPDMYKTLFDIKKISENSENFRILLKEVLNNLELRLIKISSPSKQIDLNGNKIKENYLILI